MADKLTFGTVHRLLSDLGFVRTTGTKPRPHVLFEHKPSDTVLVIRPHSDDEPVDRMTLAVVRKWLDEKGLLEGSAFEDALREAAADGKARTKRK